MPPSSPVAWHANACGIRSHEEELHTARRFPIISVQETGFRQLDHSRDTLARIWPDHQVAAEFLQDGEGIGCCLLISRHLRWRPALRRTSLRHRLLGVDVFLDGMWLRVSSLYVPPVASGAAFDTGLLAAGLDSPHALLLGDLNARAEVLGCRSTNSHGRTFAGFMEDNTSVVSLNDPVTPTLLHRSCGFQDAVDWALATASTARLLRAAVGDSIGSDHLPLAVFSSRPSPAGRRSSQVPRWRTSSLPTATWDAFEVEADSQLLEADLYPPPTPSTPAEVDALAEDLQRALQSAADACLQRSRPHSDSARLPAPWWIILLIRHRNRLRRQLSRRSPAPPDLRQQLACLRNTIHRELAAFRRQRLHDKARLFSEGPRRRGLQFWAGIRTWFRGAGQHLPPLTTDSDSLAVTPQERADVFATHLQQTFSGLSDPEFDRAFRSEVEDSVGSDPLLLPLQRLPDDEAAPDQDVVTRPVSPAEVRAELRRLHSGKAPGPDGLSSDLLRHCPDSATSVLAALFSASLRLGYFPRRWRHGLVRMLPKPGRPHTSATDFRPITLASSTGKVLERLVARRLSLLCEERGLLPEEQSAFRPARGTEEQLVLTTQRLSQALNGGLAAALVALDLHKAFDSVWRAGLVFQLRDATSPAIARWVASFLHHRQATVLEDGTTSRTFTTAAGVPQGSPLSPLLFVLFTASMPLPREVTAGASLYADDLALWACAATPAAALARIQPHLTDAVRWGRRWRMRFNPAKTQVGWFSRRPRWPPDALGTPHLLDTDLRWSDSVDLLGVRLDRRLQLLPHANRLAARLWPRIQDLRRWTWAFHRTPPWVGALLYKVLIRPALTYAAPVWTLACNTARERLHRTERHGLRAALRLGHTAGLEQLYQRTQPLDEFLRLTSSRFLLRAAETRHRRLLLGFVSLAHQRSDRARFDPPLERLFALLDDDEREIVTTALDELNIRRGPNDTCNRGRNRRQETDLWGVSPFF